MGGDEILLDDTRRLHEKLIAAGCDSKMITAPERWHAYVLYYLNENMSDFEEMGRFLNRVMGGRSIPPRAAATGTTCSGFPPR